MKAFFGKKYCLWPTVFDKNLWLWAALFIQNEELLHEKIGIVWLLSLRFTIGCIFENKKKFGRPA